MRELENIIERAFIITESSIIESSDIEIKENHSVVPANPLSLKKIEKQTIVEALHRWEGNRTKAAEELGVSRRTVLNKIKEYGIDTTGSKESTKH